MRVSSIEHNPDIVGIYILFSVIDCAATHPGGGTAVEADLALLLQVADGALHAAARRHRLQDLAQGHLALKVAEAVDDDDGAGRAGVVGDATLGEQHPNSPLSSANTRQIITLWRTIYM